jgi:hypothetical protein
MKGELHVTIVIKVAHCVCDVLFLELSVPILSEILANLPTVKVAQGISVDSLKRSVGLKLLHDSKSLSLLLNGHLG